MAPYGPSMGPYGSIWAPYGPHMAPCGPHVGPQYGPHMGPYGSTWVPYVPHLRYILGVLSNTYPINPSKNLHKVHIKYSCAPFFCFSVVVIMCVSIVSLFLWLRAFSAAMHVLCVFQLFPFCGYMRFQLSGIFSLHFLLCSFLFISSSFASILSYFICVLS